MANNNIIFNAAFAGALGGINTSRAVDSSRGDTYNSAIASAFAFATLLDGELSPQSFNATEAALLQDIVSQVLTHKGGAGTSLTLIQGILAMWNQARGSLEPQQGASVTPLSSVLFVDVNSTAEGDQTGSISNPFTLIQGAVNASVDGGSIYIAPGDYSGEAVEIFGKSVSLVGMNAPSNINIIVNRGPDSIVHDGELYIENLGFIGAGGTGDGITSSNSVYLVNTSCRRIAADSGLPVTIVLMGSNPEVNRLQLIEAEGSTLQAMGYTVGDLQITSIGFISAYNCYFAPGALPGDDITFAPNNGEVGNFIGCFFPDSLAITGPASSFITLDEIGYGNLTANLSVFTGVIPRPVSGGECIVSVVVPAIAAAGELAYVDVVLTGALTNVLIGNFDMVVAAPVSDLSAAGANRGSYLFCRCTAVAGTVRLAFQGILAGGAVNFIFMRVGPSQAPLVTP